MEPFVQKLKDDLNRTARLLDSGEMLSFTAEESRRLQAEGQTLLHKLETMETGFLTVGLVGGTGVGKSTLMNALAGQKIAGAGDRRPHTDRILIYRHEAVEPKSMAGLTKIPHRILTHSLDAVRQVVLCDLPDFDSMVDAHRELVVRFLDHLDILLWVASVEKYADGRFYEFLETVPKAQQNFVFVLNKADQIFDPGHDRAGYTALEDILRSFQTHIEQSGAKNPLIFTVSAEMAFRKETVAPWNQFPFLNREIFQQRDLKAVAAVKALNLDVEIRNHRSSLQKERQNLENFERILDSVRDDIADRLPQWHDTGRQAIARWIDDRLGRTMVGRQADISCLTGPGYLVGLLAEAWSNRFEAGGSHRPGFSEAALARDMAALFNRRLQWPAERLCRQRAYQGLPEPFDGKIRAAVDPDGLSEDMAERFRRMFSFYLSESNRTCRLFLAGQRLTYVVVFLFFLVAIGGASPWRAMLESPGWRNLFHLAVSMFHTLFSERGLAALGSLILIHVFLGVRFFHRFRNRREKAAHKRLAAMTSAAGDLWRETLQAMTDRIDGLRQHIQDRIAEVSQEEGPPFRT